MCEVRSGKGRIEYNPERLGSHTVQEQELIFRAELIRLLLQHPYARKPEGCSQRAISLASDFVITSFYSEMDSLFACPSDLHLPDRCGYEWYAGRIREKEDNSQGSQSEEEKKEEETSDSECSGNEDGQNQSLSDRSGLWEEDPWIQEEVRNVVLQTNDWGTVPGSMVEQIVANAKLKVDYHKVLSGFRASTLSTKRKLTRMRPNRRTEFENMGSLYQLQTRYLCAIDVSGSISGEDLKNFFSIINRFFKYGVEKIDVITCDTEIHDVIEFKKAKSLISVSGRGGTIFQPVINYMEDHPEYDGLIFFTDGYAEFPEIHIKSIIHRILWFLPGEEEYINSRDWMKTMGRVCYLCGN